MGRKTRMADSHRAAALKLLPRLTPEELRFILTQSGAPGAPGAGEPQLYDQAQAAVRTGEIDPSAINLLFAVRRNHSGGRSNV